MASIRKRNGRWQVQVRRKGCAPLSRTFTAKSDAVAWSRQMDMEADRSGLAPDPKMLERITVADILRRYWDEIAVVKRSCRSEGGILLKAMLDRKLVRVASRI